MASFALIAVPARAEPAPHLQPQTDQLDRDGGEVAGKGWQQNRLRNASLPPPVWPGPQSAQVRLDPADASSASGVKAGAMPVRLSPSGKAAAAKSTDVTVRLVDRQTLPRAWRNGLLLNISTADSVPVEATTSVDYNAFRYAFGGDWASRLKLWQVPACALSTPDSAQCRAVALRTDNDTVAGTASAQIVVPAAEPRPRTKAQAAADAGEPKRTGVMVMLAADSAGSDGDFGMSSLTLSSSWSAGGSSGNFSWNYAMRSPPIGAGPNPKVSLSYSSSSVDGRSQASNNQPSWLGEGFDFWPGYIERRYVSCSDDMKNGGTNTTRTADQCWRSENATLSLNGRGSELVFDAATGWHQRSEDGSKVEKVTGAVNGDDNGEYWKVTTNDGTQYFFGLHQLPGQSSVTESVNTVRVYGNHAGEPCYNANFANGYCNQAWRWNLDYVVDVRGNTMSYWYSKEWQKYGANNTASNVVPYVRASALTRIDYGTYWRTMAEHGVNEQTVTPTAQVVFEPRDRCVAASCWTGTQPVLENWPDTPWDQDCKMDATSCPMQYSPTFWTTKRLGKITTKVWDTTKTAAGWQDVEAWTLNHTFPAPGDGTHAGLWLDSIGHEGLVGGTATSAPITFEPISLANRVLTGHNTTNNWLRISNIVIESGAKIHVDYSQPECSGVNSPAEAHNNTMLCYPVLVPDPADPTGEALLTEYWQKYVVTHVAEDDVPLADGHQSLSKHTWYRYLGAPAWHYTDDDGLSKPDRRTWSEFRGYATVETKVGATATSPDATLSVTNYLRGMNGDRAAPSGGHRNVSVGATIGTETVVDEDQFAGVTREETVYRGLDTRPVSRKVNVPWRSDPTASRTINGDTVTARFSNTMTSYNATALGVDGSRGWRISRGQQNFDNTYGTVNWSQNDGDINVTGDEKCISYTYNRNTAKNLVTLVKQSTTIALPCGQAPASVDDVVSDERSYYDGAANLDTPAAFGLQTKTEKLKDWTPAGGTQWQVDSQTTFDTTGRPKNVTDIKGNVTAKAYVPSIGGPVTKVTTTESTPFNWQSSAESNPYWGSVTRKTDVNGALEGEAVFDPFGRVRKVWTLGLTIAANPSTPSHEYIYNTPPNRDTYPYISIKTLNAKGNYVTSYQILDGWMRPRQTQSMSLNGDGSRVVTDTIYDRFGRTTAEYAAHSEPGAPSGTLWWEPEWSLPSVTKTEFDTAGRPVASVFYSGDGVTNLVEKWRSTKAFEGDLVKNTPALGGVATTTLTDIEGATTALRQHTTSAGVNGAYSETQFVHNRKEQLAKVIDPAGNEWVYTYDAKGRQTKVKDPDKGETISEYNDANELIKTTDARGEVLFYVYDELGRKKQLRDDSATGPLRAEWKYDTLYSGQTGFRGQLTQSIRYEPAGSANAYKWQIRQMDARYQPTGINVVIPGSELGLDATYVYSMSYSSFNGVQTSMTYPAAGDLPAETVTTDYDTTTGQAVRLDTNRTGEAGTMMSAWYTPFGELSMTTRKMPGGVFVDDSVEYDPYTRRISRTTVKPETATGKVSDRNYSYDAVGNILSVEEKPEVGSGEKQCFRYSTVNELKEAWTPPAATDCAVDPSAGSLAGPAPYWTSWTFDTTGSRLSEVSHTSTGDTTRGYARPNGGLNVVRPHAVTSMTITPPNQTGVTVNYGYDSAGNMTCRPSGTATNTCPTGTGSQKLSWNAEGKLEKVEIGTATVETNLYDVSGARLVRRDTTGTTIYLPGQEIRREGTVNKGTRYYTFKGELSASRNGAALSWLYDDHQGTQQIAVRADTQAVSVRRQTPYGGSRGTQPAWANQKGFVGGDNDPTGLVNIGARQYDSALGRFISVDPMLTAEDPVQYNAYQYAGNNPIGNSDPDGMQDLCGNDANDNCNHEQDPESTGEPCPWCAHVPTPAEIEAHRKAAEEERKRQECMADFWCRQGQKLKDAGNATKNWAINASDAVGDGLKVVGKWVVDHKGLIATVLATAGCLIPAVGLALCAVFQAAAFAFRTVDTITQEGGWEKNKTKIIFDGVTTALTLGMGGAMRMARFDTLKGLKGAPLIPFGAKAKQALAAFETPGWKNLATPLIKFGSPLNKIPLVNKIPDAVSIATLAPVIGWTAPKAIAGCGMKSCLTGLTQGSGNGA